MDFDKFTRRFLRTSAVVGALFYLGSTEQDGVTETGLRIDPPEEKTTPATEQKAEADNATALFELNQFDVAEGTLNPQDSTEIAQQNARLDSLMKESGLTPQ